MSDSVLPTHSTDLERTVEEVVAARLAAIPMTFSALWSIEDCPPQFLADLAYTLSVDAWRSEWSDSRKRSVIAASAEVHRRKGTVGAIKRALASAGYVDATIIERTPVSYYDGTLAHDATETYRVQGHWATYRVALRNPITIEQGRHLRALLDATAPARCELTALDFAEVGHLYDDTIRHDGTYSYGAA